MKVEKSSWYSSIQGSMCKTITFISENEEEKKLLTNDGYCVPDSSIKQARMVYYNKGDRFLIKELRFDVYVRMMLKIAKYLYKQQENHEFKVNE